jgi:signal transduction histidine kinase/ActR/RegA family two-component response regulator
MSLFPPIPREPPARLRLLTFWFALFAIGVDIVELSTPGIASQNARLLGLGASVLLLGWVWRGYQRQGFPEWTTPIEGLLLVAVTAGSSLPLRSMGLFLAILMFRAVYVSRREIWLLPVAYGLARVIGMELTPDPAPYDAWSSTVMFQFIGLAFIGAILFMLMQALEKEARTQLQMREAQKMEAVGQLAGGVAHDFNNLLTVIGGHIYMLENGPELDEKLRRHITGITQATERAGSLTRQLLAFGGRQMMHPRVVDANGVVRDAVRLLNPVVGERISIVADLDENVIAVKADVGQLEQVLINLGLNARDAMPEGGTLTIATARTGEADNRRIVIRFTDSGTGMDASTAAHVFEPFFTTKRGGRGTGLGLATAYGIVRQSGGDIKVESVVGQGSTFTISLPAAPEGAVIEEEVVAAAGVPGPLSVKRVLLVEDDEGVRNFVREVLERSGVRVSVANDGVDGLAVAREANYVFDLLITDVVMPRMNGRQMVERLRQSAPKMRVLFMTGYADNAITRGELDPAIELLIEKPFSARTLRNAVETVAAATPHIPNVLASR